MRYEIKENQGLHKLYKYMRNPLNEDKDNIELLYLLNEDNLL